jgi:hypothetical protein
MMRFLGWRTLLLALVALQLGLAGCSTPQRLSAAMPEAAGTVGTTRFLASRQSDSFKGEAMRSLEKEKVFLASKGLPASFNTPHREEFDTAYMRSLFDLGVNAKAEAP